MRFRPVPDLNRGSRHRHLSSGFQPGGRQVCRQTALRSSDGPCAVEDVSSHRAPLPGRSSGQAVHLRRAVPLHGLCATHVPREPAGHRSLSLGPGQQARPYGAAHGRQPDHAGRCERSAGLAHLCGICPGPHPDRPAAVCSGRPRTEARKHDLCLAGPSATCGPGASTRRRSTGARGSSATRPSCSRASIPAIAILRICGGSSTRIPRPVRRWSC